MRKWFYKKELVLTKKNREAIKMLTIPYLSCGGRSRGRTTVFHRGGGVKRRLRNVDFEQSISYIPSIIKRVEYAPGRSGFIFLVLYQNGTLGYRLAIKGLRVGNFMFNNPSGFFSKRLGCGVRLRHLVSGIRISQVAFQNGREGKIARSAGNSVQFLKHINTSYSLVKMPSGEQRLLPRSCGAVVGIIANSNHRELFYQTAGTQRRLGRRPIVRGLAMNPIDHPHGGGDTKGCHPRSPWGVLTKGWRTVRTRHKLIVKPRFKKLGKRK